MSTTDPRSGIIYGWAFDDSTWAGEMDANLARIGRFAFHLSVKDRDLTSPPATPTAGDCYIVASGGSGAWASQDTKVVVWTGSAWAVGTPRVGWLCYIEDEMKMSVYRSGAWSSGISI